MEFGVFDTRLFYAKKVPAMAGTKMCGMDAFYASQSSLLLRVSQSSPKTVPKPQQERGFAVGEKRSKGKRISSKPLQGSLFVAFVVQRSGTPVSYTHLDVYKRQHQKGRHHIFCDTFQTALQIEGKNKERNNQCNQQEQHIDRW